MNLCSIVGSMSTVWALRGQVRDTSEGSARLKQTCLCVSLSLSFCACLSACARVWLYVCGHIVRMPTYPDSCVLIISQTTAHAPISADQDF